MEHSKEPLSLERKIDNLRKEILGSGFPTEIQVSQTLRDDGWFVINQAPYFDSQVNEHQFIDVFALKKGVCLVIECKKTFKAHPWVFFTQSKNDMWIAAASMMPLLGKEYPQNCHWLDPSVRVGTIFMSPFDKKEEDKRKNQFLISMKQIQSIMTHFFAVQSMATYPIVVYDGEIYEFTNLEIDLKPVNSLQYIHVQMKNGVVWPFLVDVVVLKHFSEFLKTLDKETPPQ